MPMDKKRYPKNWHEIATAVKDAAGWKCQQCGKQCRKPGEPFDTHKRTLTVAHLNHTPEDCRPENLKALCAPCHLRYDAPHHAETRRRRRNAENVKNGTDTQPNPKQGRSARDNRECGEIYERHNMANHYNQDLSTRQGFVEAIEESGKYIQDHASNLLGEYPASLCEMDVVARFRFNEPPIVEVRRQHITLPQSLYPQNSADVDSVEKVCRDMYREIIEHDEKHPDEVPPDDDTRRAYGDRLQALGVRL